jgi:N,N-dimethylformamidase
VIFFREAGVVVSASAMAWVGALHVNGYDNDAERFVRNVVTRFLDPEPIARPEPTQG